MATAAINSLTITKDTANADVELIYTVNYDEFEVQTNLDSSSRLWCLDGDRCLC